MARSVTRLAEVLLMRAAPGLLNLFTLTLLGKWMAPSKYGVFSTVVATAGFISSLFFGPLQFAIVSQHAKMRAEQKLAAYESAVVFGVLAIGVLIALLGTAGVLLRFFDWTWIPVVVAFGTYTAIQELLHAHLRLWAYGSASLLQSTVFLLGVWLGGPHGAQPETVLAIFSGSYALAAALSFILSNRPRPNWRHHKLLVETFGLGAPYTVSVMAENGMYVGIRYVILWTGHPQQLGVFSFSVDIAQRLLGFLINAASFVFVPLAFKAQAKGDGASFRKTLVDGTKLSVSLALAAYIGVVVLQQLRIVPSLNQPIFDIYVFSLVSIAIVVNRSKKLLLDPLLFRAGKTRGILIGYALGTPVALGCAGLWASADSGVLTACCYMAGYLVAAVSTVIIYWRVERSEKVY